MLCTRSTVPRSLTSQPPTLPTTRYESVRLGREPVESPGCPKGRLSLPSQGRQTGIQRLRAGLRPLLANSLLSGSFVLLKEHLTRTGVHRGLLQRRMAGPYRTFFLESGAGAKGFPQSSLRGIRTSVLTVEIKTKRKSKACLCRSEVERFATVSVSVLKRPGQLAPELGGSLSGEARRRHRPCDLRFCEILVNFIPV